MNRCLRDKTLLLLHDGEGTGAQRAHLTGCEACAARYRQLGRDLEAISQVLREDPPPQTVRHRFGPLAVRWLPTAVAVALALMLMWGGVRIWRPSIRPLLNEEIWTLVGESSADLFLLNQAIAEEVWMKTVDSDAAVALEAERPCETEVESLDGGFGDFGGYSCVELKPGHSERLLKPKE